MTFLEQLEQTPPAAKMVLPGAILALVSRQKHPIVWWLFGVLPMASAVSQAFTEKRLFGPPAPAIASRAPFMPTSSTTPAEFTVPHDPTGAQFW